MRNSGLLGDRWTLEMPGFLVDYSRPREACPVCAERESKGKVVFRDTTKFVELRGTTTVLECVDCLRVTHAMEAQLAMMDARDGLKARAESRRIAPLDLTMFTMKFNALCSRFRRDALPTVKWAYYNEISGRLTQQEYLKGVDSAISNCEFMPKAGEIIRRGKRR
jgi:hypothetical protein